MTDNGYKEQGDKECENSQQQGRSKDYYTQPDQGTDPYEQQSCLSADAYGRETSMTYQDAGQESMRPRRIIGRIGWALFLMAAAVIAVQYLIFYMVERYAPEYTNKGWLALSVTAISVIGVALPIIHGMLKNVPSPVRAPKTRLSLLQFIGLFFVSASLMYLANYVSVFITFIISIAKGKDITNPAADTIFGSSMWMTVAYVAILGPIVEEVIFRKILLDKLRGFGDLPAILFTGFAFGLFHMNLSQFIYATVLGFIFAYVTIRTNTIFYSVVLHILINTIGSVVAPAAVVSGNPGFLMLVALWVIVSIALGLVLFVRNAKKILLVRGRLALKSKAYYFFNPGMLLFSLMCIAMTVLLLIA